MAKRTVLITGCSTGFGRAAALKFRDEGWNVAATMRDVSKWTGGSSESLLVLPLDVGNKSSIESAVDRVVQQFGSLDCVVNNAGSGLFSVFEATPLDTVRAIFETNVFGMMQVIKTILPHFQNKGGGRIVNVSSSSSIMPEPFMAAYSASKWAMEGFTESLRYELATQNIQLKLIEPGLVKETRFVEKTAAASQAFPIPPSYQAYANQVMVLYLGEPTFRLGTEAEVAAAIFTAASDSSETLRYPVGEDANTVAHMRRETSEQKYSAWTKARFWPRQP